MLKARALTAVGIEYKDTGRYDQAARTYNEALELVTAAQGSHHLSTASLWHNLAGLALARATPTKQHRLPPEPSKFANTNSDPIITSSPRPRRPRRRAADEGRIDEAESRSSAPSQSFTAGHPADRYEVAVNLSNLGICQLLAW